MAAWNYHYTFLGQAWIDDILLAIEKTLVASLGLPADCILISLAADEDHQEMPPADRFAVIRPTDFPIGPGFEGAGRELTGLDGVFRIAVFTRYQADQELRDKRALTDRTQGVLALVRKTLDIMQAFVPVQTTAPTVALVREPMQFLGFSIGSASLKRRSPWSVTPMLFGAKFNVPLTGSILS